MRLHRLLGIIMLLDSRGIMKAGHLAKILETSERTIYRDIDILCETGLPIVSIPGPQGGYSFMADYKINANVLESGDVFNLLLSSMGVRPEKDTETAYQLKNALIKLENSVSEKHRPEIMRAKERFFIDSDPWWGKRTPNKHVDIIKNSILHLKKLEVSYKKYNEELSKRILNPYGAVVKSDEWYMVAFCEDKYDIRVFKCSRIEGIQVLDETFSIPPSFSLEAFWENNKQNFIKQTTIKEVPCSYPVKVRSLDEKPLLLKDFPLLSSVQLENVWIYEIDLLSFETACRVILPFSDQIEVLDPLELRQYLLTKAQKILTLYKIL
jgi:predicted DNA-binding transcriptional regulator YafY